jgi:hypothetical protein
MLLHLEVLNSLENLGHVTCLVNFLWLITIGQDI